MSKGSKPRPLGISREQFESNWDKVFLKEVPEHDNPTEGGMWVHDCTMERMPFEHGGHGDNYIATAKGYPCNWCGKYEGDA